MPYFCLAVGARDKSGALGPAAAYQLIKRDNLPTVGEELELAPGLSLPVHEVLPLVNGLACITFITDDILDLVHLGAQPEWSYYLNVAA